MFKFVMYSFIKHHPDFRISSAIKFARYSIKRKSHYDVLNLRQNCTDKEIKEAFFKMSKEYHPDKNKDKNAQQKFVQIVEAYNTLGKPMSRAQYDTMMEVNTRPTYNTHNAYEAYNHYKYRHNYYQRYSQKEEQETRNAQREYYGVQGLKKVPNYIIIMLCFGIAFVGTMLQILVIREIYIENKRKALEESRFLAEELERVREAAKTTTNDIRTRLMLEKIVQSANPTIATASLGQALASEKKDYENVLNEVGLSDVLDAYQHLEPEERNTDEVTIDDLVRNMRSYSR